MFTRNTFFKQTSSVPVVNLISLELESKTLVNVPGNTTIVVYKTMVQTTPITSKRWQAPPIWLGPCVLQPQSTTGRVFRFTFRKGSTVNRTMSASTATVLIVTLLLHPKREEPKYMETMSLSVRTTNAVSFKVTYGTTTPSDRCTPPS